MIVGRSVPLSLPMTAVAAWAILVVEAKECGDALATIEIARVTEDGDDRGLEGVWRHGGWLVSGAGRGCGWRIMGRIPMQGEPAAWRFVPPKGLTAGSRRR